RRLGHCCPNDAVTSEGCDLRFVEPGLAQDLSGVFPERGRMAPRPGARLCEPDRVMRYQIPAMDRVIERGDGFVGEGLRIGERVVKVVDRPAGHAGSVKLGEPVRGRLSGKECFEWTADFRTMRDAAGVRDKTRVIKIAIAAEQWQHLLPELV